MTTTTWQKNLSVDLRIVRLLSAKTYEDFPNALRELVSNAFDADATQVSISINVEKDFLEVIDDGNGMTPDEFDFFLRIAGSQRGKDVSPIFKRKRIGQFGIGFLAIFPFGKTITVKSTARNSDILFEAIIPSEEFLEENITPIDIEKIPIPGTEARDSIYLNQNGTTIRITGLTGLTHLFFSRDDQKLDNRYVRNWNPIEKLIWWLQDNLPLDYPHDSIYKDVFGDLKLSNLKVIFNGKELKRNSPGKYKLEEGTWNYEDVFCRYCIATDWKAIQPFEERFLKQRLRNVGVDSRENFDLHTLGRTFSRLHWLTGEIHLVEGMGDLISIDRQKFYDTPKYEAMKEFFRDKLRHFAYYVEDVDVARRDISKQLRDARGAEVGGRKEIIERNVKKLESRGFTVISKDMPPLQKDFSSELGKDMSPRHIPKYYRDDIDKPPPVNINISKKIVEIIDDHPDFVDTITIDGKKFSSSTVFCGLRKMRQN